MALACIDHLTFLEMMFNNPNDISDYANAVAHIGSNSWISPNVLNYRDIVKIQQDKYNMSNREEKRNKVIGMFKKKFKEKYNDYDPENKKTDYILSKVDGGKELSKDKKAFISNFGRKINMAQKYIAESKDKPVNVDQGSQDTIQEENENTADVIEGDDPKGDDPK